MTSIDIVCGRERLPLFCPERTRQLFAKEPEKVISQALFQQRLELFLQRSPLDLSRPVVVVADKTRLCGYPEYLPLLIRTLLHHGMQRDRFTIIVGYGTHPRQSEEECLQAYGRCYTQYPFIHHNCLEKNAFVELGRTRRNTPIRLRKDIAEASAVITMGAVSHHYFAGFGGGRKLIFPGCGEREAIYANHSLYLDSHARILSPFSQPGILAGNPLAEDLFEIEEQRPADLAIHGILDSRGRLCDLLVGRGRTQFLEACAIHAGYYEVVAPRFDLVIGSCGGYPKDINFIQSHKAIHNAAMFVRDGGLLLVYAECCDGIGSQTFLPWLQKGSFAAAFNELAQRYEGNGGTALAMMTKLQRIRIGIISRLDEKTCRLIGVERWSHEEVNRYLAALGKEHSVGCIPNSSLLVKNQ
ncbi:MAG: lactate racemase domain-containing protein [Desulforhopalus sp.]